MTSLPQSYESFDYSVRPSKQVERKLIVEILHHLNQDVKSLRLREYSYVGFGSPYYTDFVLFHKYLYVARMYCVEGTDIPKRMAFNKPYDFIELRMGLFSEFLPDLDREAPHILWLDYDTALTEENLQDIVGATAVLKPGSFLFVTLDAEGRIPEDLDVPDRSMDEKVEDTIDRYQEIFGRYTRGRIGRRQFTKATLPRLFTTVVRNAIEEECRSRKLVFLQLFNVRYADGAQMVSLGGLIADSDMADEVAKSSVYDLPFVSQEPEPSNITVPPLTSRERLWLEQNLSSDAREFELDDKLAESFRQLYRYYPVYSEALL